MSWRTHFSHVKFLADVLSRLFASQAANRPVRTRPRTVRVFQTSYCGLTDLMIANASFGLPADVGLIRPLGPLLTIGTAIRGWPRPQFLGVVPLSGCLSGAVANYL